MDRKPEHGYGFYKTAAVTFPVEVGNVFKNAEKIVEYINKAEEKNVQLVVFPELSLTGYTCADMFLRNDFIKQAEYAFRDVKAATAKKSILVCVGMPVEEHGKLYNCAVYVQGGSIIGVVPKTYIPNYGEFYEKRWFVSSTCRKTNTISFCGSIVPFSEKLLLRGDDGIVIGTEICEDLWVDSPPSGLLSRAGATVIVNPSASNDVIGKRQYRRNLVGMQSGRCRCAYIYASCGAGESSTDLVFSGHCMIAENGKILKETRNSMETEEMITGVVDIEKCIVDRRKFNSDVWADIPDVTETRIFTSGWPKILPDTVEAYPFVPSDKTARSERCEEILQMQAKGLIQRLKATKITNVVLGLSGGLDSTLALIVCCKAFDFLKINRENIHCISMPGFGTSEKTRKISEKLAEEFRVAFKEIDIRKSCLTHMKDIGHKDDVYDVAYENIQARERTQILFDCSNMINALVIGTGDMSELALGWCTYNGDHMSNYAVNIGVPKTLVKWIVKFYADSTGSKVLNDVFNLPISPELLPTDKDGNIQQKTEESIGKYDLHDFFLYHFLRNGFGKIKIQKLAEIAFPQISVDEIKATLDTFYNRFRTQQFKRSCIPDGVKIGSVALSPRGDLRLPSDLSMMY